MAVPLNGVKADESGEDRFVEVGVLRRVGVRVTFEHLEGITIQEVTTTVPTICDNSALQSRRGINTIKEVYYIVGLFRSNISAEAIMLTS